jgi:F-type H+-transporting ATPase subunit delta
MATDRRIEGYAEALFDVANAEGLLDVVENELYQVARVVQGSDDLRSTLTDAAIPADRRQAIVEDLLGAKGATNITRSLVSFLVAAGRARDLPAIVDEFVRRAATERQHEVAEVRSAIPLDGEQQRRLAEALSSATGKQIEVKVTVDPTVLGGLVSRIGDRVIDGSIATRLQQLRNTL